MGRSYLGTNAAEAIFVFAYAPPALHAGYYSRAVCAKPSSNARKRLLHDGPGLAMAQPRAHEAGGVMSYGPNASDSVPVLRRGREGGGQQAVSSLNESTLVPCAKCVQQNSAHSRESGNPGQGPGSLQRGPRDANVAGCLSRGRGERGGFCRYQGTKIPIHPL